MRASNSIQLTPRIAWCGLTFLSSIVLAQSPTLPVELRDGGREIVRATSHADASSWSMRLPSPAISVHVTGDDFIVVRERSRYRFIAGGPPGSNKAALLRTLPLRTRQAVFKRVSSDNQRLEFESGPVLEEISIPALRDGRFYSVVTQGNRSPNASSERLLTPVTEVFWNPLRPSGYVGPGHGNRAQVVAAFSATRPNELIDEYEPFDCPLPLQSTGRDWVPIQTHVFEHTLRDRQGNQLVFFTASESADVTYESEPEAAARGCEASYLRHRSNAPRSYDFIHEPDSDSEFVLRLELMDQGIPAEGVIVRVREGDMFAEQSCGAPNPSTVPDLNSDDGRTLADGSYAWKRFRRPQGADHRRMQFTIKSVAATLCIRMDGQWIPIWHSKRERRGYRVRCDLALPGAQRCKKIE